MRLHGNIDIYIMRIIKIRNLHDLDTGIENLCSVRAWHCCIIKILLIYLFNRDIRFYFNSFPSMLFKNVCESFMLF